MLKLPKPAAIAIQATLGLALSTSWAVSALATPADTATQSQTTPRLQEGDLVRLRSGGPEMTVKSVRGTWVIAIWSPYLTVEDATKLDTVRRALREGDVGTAAKYGRVFQLLPIPA